MGEPTFRCGWRVKRQTGDSWPYPAPAVMIQRGEWRAVMPAEVFEEMPDDEFTNMMSQLYRDAAFARLKQDLDVLARHIIGQIGHGDCAFFSDEPDADVKAALYRYQKAKRDTQEITT